MSEREIDSEADFVGFLELAELGFRYVLIDRDGAVVVASRSPLAACPGLSVAEHFDGGDENSPNWSWFWVG